VGGDPINRTDASGLCSEDFNQVLSDSDLQGLGTYGFLYYGPCDFDGTGALLSGQNDDLTVTATVEPAPPPLLAIPPGLDDIDSPMAIQVFSMINQMNPGGFISACAGLQVGTALGFGAVTAAGSIAGFVLPAAAAAQSILAPPPNVASTFTMGAWSYQIPTVAIDAFRFSNATNPVGGYLTTTTISSSASATSLLSLPSVPTQVANATILAGNPFYFGNVAPNFGFPGGGVQLWVPDPSNVFFGVPNPLP
jgi:hypothetical protein